MKVKHKTPLKRIILLFIVYSFLFVTLFSFLDYYDYYVINPILLIVISIGIGIVLTLLHIKNGKRSQIDDLADKL